MSIYTDDQSEGVNVAIRVRPFTDEEVNSNALRITRVQEYKQDRSLMVWLSNPRDQSERAFIFDAIFQSASPSETGIGDYATQQEVYDYFRPEFCRIFSGLDVTLMCYGSSRCGKTYSIRGPAVQSPHDMGLLPRFLRELFLRREEDESQMSITLQCVEVHCDQVNDLLLARAQWPPGGFKKKFNNMEIQDVPWTNRKVTNINDALNTLSFADKNRTFGDRQRAHTIYVVGIAQHKFSYSSQSSLTFIDLAGGERFNRLGKGKKNECRTQESNSINLSLSALRICLSDMLEGRPPKWRQNKLTMTLKPYLLHSKLLILGCVSPTHSFYDDTFASLKFLNATKALTTTPIANMTKTLPEHRHGYGSGPHEGALVQSRYHNNGGHHRGGGGTTAVLPPDSPPRAPSPSHADIMNQLEADLCDERHHYSHAAVEFESREKVMSAQLQEAFQEADWYRQKWATAMQQMDSTERRLQELKVQTDQDKNSLDNARREFEAEQRAFQARKEREQREAEVRRAVEMDNQKFSNNAFGGDRDEDMDAAARGKAKLAARRQARGVISGIDSSDEEGDSPQRPKKEKNLTIIGPTNVFGDADDNLNWAKPRIPISTAPLIPTTPNFNMGMGFGSTTAGGGGGVSNATLTPTAFQQPTFQQPTTFQPTAFQQPTFPQSTFQQPTFDPSTFQQPTFPQSAFQQPTFEQSAFQQPTFQQSTFQQPTFDQSTFQQPTFQPTMDTFGGTASTATYDPFNTGAAYNPYSVTPSSFASTPNTVSSAQYSVASPYDPTAAFNPIFGGTASTATTQFSTGVPGMYQPMATTAPGMSGTIDAPLSFQPY